MKLSETCTCGADFTVEGDDIAEARIDLVAWRSTHRCGVRTNSVDPHSVVGGQFSLGFGTEAEELRT